MPGRPPPLLGLGIGLLILYVATLLPGAGHTGDTAKFQLVGAVLGIPHPPGYPLYCLLNHLFVNLVSWQSIAWRANLLSAVCAVGACLLLAESLRRVAPRAALPMAAACAVTPLFWRHAVVAEVYAPLLLLQAAITLGLVRWRTEGRPRDLALAGGIWGLALGHHPLILPTLPALLAAVALAGRGGLRRPALWLGLAGGAVLGLGSYGYILVRSADPATPYLEFEATGLRSLLWHLRGGQFTGKMFAFGPATLLGERLPLYARLLVDQAGPLLVLALAGLRRLDRCLGAYVGVTVLGNLLVVVNYGISDVAIYVLPAVLVLTIPAAAGAEVLADLIARRAPAFRPAWLWVVPLALAATNFSAANLAGERREAERCERVLATARERALIVEPWYVGSQILWYYLLAERWQAERGIHTIRDVDAAAIAGYVLDGAPLTIGKQRRDLPPGLTVYTLWGNWAEALAHEGCAVRELEHGLFRIERPGEPAEESAGAPPGKRRR